VTTGAAQDQRGAELRTAVVSGASRGIGLAVARALVAQNIRVAMLARRWEPLREAAQSLGPLARAMPCDVGDAAALEALVGHVRAEFGQAPDIVVNNAGLFKLSTVETTDTADFERAIDVNLVAPFRLIRAFLPEMRARKRGHIVSIGSIADRATFAENGAYAASKFGLRGFHGVLRAELAGSGVRATLVSPGPVDTALWDDVDTAGRPGFLPRSAMLSADAVGAAVAYAILQPPEVNIDELRISRS
jgi:NADP-dependent 3-hydroxy acid dehydrogenase YdfG